MGLLVGFTCIGGSAKAQSISNTDSTGLPGDNFSLQGALAMFKKASSPEEFEKFLNTEGNDVNNLDLNNDGETDYVKVIDKSEGDAHAFVLQVPVSETENQDIAVIELEKTGDNTAVIQIVGDEDIYGEETIVEPADDEKETSWLNSTDAVYAHGPSQYTDEESIIVNVWFWPSVKFIYGPAYRVWISPWHWRNRPVWWHPWRPAPFRVFYPRRSFYRSHYVVVHTNRVIRAHNVYRPVRVTSVTVRTHNQVSVNRYRANRTVQRKTVTVSNGNRQVKATRRTTTIEGKQGRVKANRTTIIKKRKR